jgi:hypothetical protein
VIVNARGGVNVRQKVESTSVRQILKNKQNGKIQKSPMDSSKPLALQA